MQRTWYILGSSRACCFSVCELILDLFSWFKKTLFSWCPLCPLAPTFLWLHLYGVAWHLEEQFDEDILFRHDRFQISLCVLCLVVVYVFVPTCCRGRISDDGWIMHWFFEYSRISLGIFYCNFLFFRLVIFYFTLGLWANVGLFHPAPSCLGSRLEF